MSTSGFHLHENVNMGFSTHTLVFTHTQVYTSHIQTQTETLIQTHAQGTGNHERERKEKKLLAIISYYHIKRM